MKIHHGTLSAGRRLGIAAGILAFVSVGALANGLRNPPESAAGLGTVGGRYTLVEDASASAYNPANLTEVNEPSALISLDFVRAETEFTSPLGGTANTKAEWKMLPDAFIAYPANSWVLGVGITTPFGQSTEWEEGGAFDFVAPQFVELKVVNVNPTIARKLTDTVSIGVGLDLFWSQLTIRQRYPWGMITGNRMDPPGLAEFKGEGEGVGANAGLTWRMTPRQTVGLSYRSSVKVDYDGNFEISNIPASLQMAVAPSSDFETSIEFPDIVGLGYAVKVTDDLRIGVDVEWIQFSKFDSMTLDVGSNSMLLPASTVPENWKDIWTAGLGAAWRLAPEWTVRGGYIFMQSPVPEETLSPTLPDSDQHVVSAGVGYRKGRQRVDASYAVSFNKDRSVDGNVDPAYNGEYEIKTSHMLMLAYGLVF